MTTRFSRQAPIKRRTLSSAMLTELVTSTGGVCRVCNGLIEPGELARYRAWGNEKAHVACGWFRADEGAPREVVRPGTVFAFWEWRCPECGLDACAQHKPMAAYELGPPGRCGRCRKPVVDQWARTVRPLVYRGVRIAPGMQGVVREMVGDIAVVMFATAAVPVPVSTIERTTNGERHAKAP